MTDQQDNTKLQQFHQGLVKSNYQVPDYATFEKTMKDPAQSKNLYDALQKDNYALPDYDTFTSDLGLKKKESPADYGMPTHEAFANIFSKVAGDIPKIESNADKTKHLSQIKDLAQQNISDQPAQYPHWTDVSNALGIPLPGESSVNPKNTEVQEPVKGTEKPPAIQPLTLPNKVENVQASDNSRANISTRDPYAFTIGDYLKQRGVSPETVGIKDMSNPDRLISGDERADFDKKLEEKGLYKPPSNYRESYIGGTVNGLYHGTAKMLRDIGYMVNTMPGQIIKPVIDKEAEVVSKMIGANPETIKKYTEQVASHLTSGFYDSSAQGMVANFVGNNYEDIAKGLEGLVKTPTPNNPVGRALENTGAFIPDLVSIGLMPEAKAPLLLKYGLQGMLKFPAYLGAKTWVEEAKAGKPLGEVAEKSAESAAQGFVYSGLGVLADEIGGIVKVLGSDEKLTDKSIFDARLKPGDWKVNAAKITMNTIGFGGIAAAQGGNVLQSLLEGGAFAMMGVPDMVKESMAKKSMLNYMTATENNIRFVAKAKLDPAQMMNESMRLSVAIQNAETPAEKERLTTQKNMVDNLNQLHFIVKSIVDHPDEFIKNIEENPNLSDREKKIWINKMRNTIKVADPRRQEASKMSDELDQLKGELNDTQKDESLSEDEKKAKTVSLNNKITKKQDEIGETLIKPLQKDELDEKNVARDREEIAKQATKELEEKQAKEEADKVEKAKAAEEEKSKIPQKEDWETWDKQTYQKKVAQLMDVMTKGDKVINSKENVKLRDDVAKWAEKDKAQKAEPPKKEEIQPQEPAFALGEKKFADKKELFKFLDENALNKDTGKTKNSWLDDVTDEIPDQATRNAIGEWEKGKSEKQKWNYSEQSPEEAKKEKDETNDRLVDLRDHYNTTPPSYRLKRAAIMRNIQGKLQQIKGYKLTTNGNDISITKENGKDIRRVAVKGTYKKLEDIESPELKGFITTLLGAKEHLYGLDIPLSLKTKDGRLTYDRAAEDLLAGKSNQGTQYLLNGLSDMYKDGVMKFKRTGNHPDIEITTGDLMKQIDDDKLKAFDEKYGASNENNLDKAAEMGLIDENEIEPIKKQFKAENDERSKAEQEWAAEEQSGAVSDKAPEGKESNSNGEKPSTKLWDKGDKDTPESVKNRFGIADQKFTPDDVDNIPRTPLWKQNGRDVIGVDDSYMKTHFYSNWTEGGNSAVYPEWNPHGEIHVGNNIPDEYKPFVVAHEIWEEYKVEKKGLKYSSPQGSAHEQSNNMEIPLRRFYDEKLKPNGGKVLSINVTDEGFNFKYKETADGPEKEATMFPDGTMKEGKHGNDLGSETENKPNEKPNEPNPPVSKGEGDNVPAGAEADKGQPAPKSEEKPATKYTPEQQKQIDAINKDYNDQITYKQKALDKMTDKARNKVIEDARAEIDRRNTLSGDADAIKDGVVKPEDQGFKVSKAPIEKATKEFDERKVELQKQIADLTKERDSKIGEITKQQSMDFGEKPPEKKAEEPKKPEGVEHNGKYYTDISEIQDDFAAGKLTKKEEQDLREQVDRWEDNLKKQAKKNSSDSEINKKINGRADDAEENLKKGNDDNHKLFMKIFPNFGISKGNTVLWKNIFMPLRDKLGNWIAGKMQAGLESQTNAIRGLSKFGEMAYRGLARTQTDVFGKKGQMGELEKRGTSGIFARNESQAVMNNLRAIVGGDADALGRVWSVLDPEMTTTPLKYADLSNSEKNLYWQVRDYNTWIHETNYANGFIDAKTYLKFKDATTGEVQYLGREYDTHLKGGEDEFAKEMRTLLATGDNSIVSGIYKMRQEVDEYKQAHAIKDPAYLTAMRLKQTIQNDAVKKYMDAVIGEHPSFVRDVKPGEDVPKGFTVLSNSRNWGPFRGKAVIHTIVEDFTGFHFANQMANTMYDMMKTFNRQKINQFYRAWRTSLNPFVQTGNYTGSHFFGAINGFSPIDIMARKGDWKKMAEERTPLYKLVEKSGVLLESGVTGEQVPDFAKKTNIYKMLSGNQSTIDKARDLFNRGQKLAGENYIAVENNVKGAAYLICRDQGLTHEQAIRRVYDSFRNYAHIGKLWDVASKTPLIGPTFIKFQADMQRILLNGITMNPLTTIGNLALISAVGSLFSAMSGESKEKQEERENRKGVPQITLPFGMSVPLSFKVGKSEVNVARYLSPFYNYHGEDNESDIADLSKFMPFQFQKADQGKLLGKISFGDATWGWVGSVIADRDFRNMSIANPTSNKFHDPNPSTEQEILNCLHYAARSQVPFYRSAEDLYDGATGKLDFYGRKRTWEQSILNNIVKIQEFGDPELKAHMERQLTYLTGKYADLAKSMGDANGDFLTKVDRARNSGISDDAILKTYKAAEAYRDKELKNSMDEQIPVYQEIERLTDVYKKWTPDDMFIIENRDRMQEGTTRRFNVLNQIDFQKNYPEQFNLLRANGMLKIPKVPEYYLGQKLSDDEKKAYSNIYWRNYLQYLDGFVGGLNKEAFDKAKNTKWDKSQSITDEGPKETNMLKTQALSAEQIANQMARATFRITKK